MEPNSAERRSNIPSPLQDYGTSELEHALLPAQGSERADIGDQQGRTKFVVVAERPQGQAPIFKADATATAIVACLDDLVLEGMLDRIIGERSGRIPALAVHLAPAGGQANLVLLRLEHGIGVQSELGQAEKGLAKGVQRADHAVRGQSLRKRVVVGLQLHIVASAVIDLEIVDDGRPTPRLIGKSKGSDGIERGKNVALAGNQGSAESGIEVIFGGDAPGEKLLGLAVARLAEESLGDAGFQFAGIGNRVVLIETNDAAEILNAGDVVVDDARLDGMFPAGFTAAPDSLQGGRPQFHAELAVGAEQSLRDRGAIDELLAIIGDSESGRAVHSQPISPVKRKSHARSKFGALHQLAGVNERIGTPHGAAHAVETKIDRQLVPERPIHGAEAHLRRASQDNAGLGLGVQEVLVIESRHIQAETPEIVGRKRVAVLLGDGGFVECGGEGQAERERAQVVDVGHAAPAVRQARGEEQMGFAAAFRNPNAVATGQSAVLDPVIVKIQVHAVSRHGAQIEALAPPSLAEGLRADLRIHPVGRRPIVRVPEHEAVHRIVGDLGEQKSRLAYALARRNAGIGKIEERNFQQPKVGANQDDLVVHSQSRADRVELPKRAVGHANRKPGLFEDVGLFRDAVDFGALEGDGVRGEKDIGVGTARYGDGSVDVKENALVAANVIAGLQTLDVLRVVVEDDVAAGNDVV